MIVFWLVIGMENNKKKKFQYWHLKIVVDFLLPPPFFGSSLEMSVGLGGGEQLLKDKKYICFHSQ